MTSVQSHIGRDRIAAFAPHELHSMQQVVDAVCHELGFAAEAQRAKREAVAQRVMAAFRAGARHPLPLVQAGLGSPSGRAVDAVHP